MLLLTTAKMSTETRNGLLFERTCIEQPQVDRYCHLEIASEKETEQYIPNSQALPSDQSEIVGKILPVALQLV